MQVLKFKGVDFIEFDSLLSDDERLVRYKRCVGAELFTADGRRILDFLSGYCVHNLGHNHPRVVAALHDELDRSGPAMLQSHVPEMAGELAAELCRQRQHAEGSGCDSTFRSGHGAATLKSTGAATARRT
jgi:4-aminobutyrate aminotransferase-like enzyme